jgi:hypothetical protein
MISHEVPHQSFAETATQIAQYFNITDASPLMSDTNKKYTPTQNACYAPSCPVQANSYTTVIISPTADNMADIYNGFIYAEMIITAAINSSIPTGCPEELALTWVGFRDSMDAIEKYEILANGISIYTQNNAIEESFIMNCAATDDTKKTDIYARVRHKDIWKYQYGPQTGVWIDWRKTNDNKNKVIKLKIDLRHFLPLSNVKYLPAFAGKIELKLFFSTNGLVVATPDPAAYLDYNIAAIAVTTMPLVTSEFVQISDPIMMPTNYTAASGSTPASITAAERIITVTRDSKVVICESLINNFGLNQTVYDSLVQRYSQQVLTYPTQILQVTTMSNVLNQQNAKASQTITPRFIDTIFLLFPLKVHHRSVFKNPVFQSFQLSCAGYGHIPSIAYGTYQEPRLIEMCANAVNLNNDTTGMNREVLNSFTLSTDVSRLDTNTSLDCTHFFIGLPTETDNTFQQGQTSNTPINYELTVTNTTGDNSYMNHVNAPPLFCLLMDATFNIMVNPSGQPPVVTIGPNDVTSPVLIQ